MNVTPMTILGSIILLKSKGLFYPNLGRKDCANHQGPNVGRALQLLNYCKSVPIIEIDEIEISETSVDGAICDGFLVNLVIGFAARCNNCCGLHYG